MHKQILELTSLYEEFLKHIGQDQFDTEQIRHKLTELNGKIFQAKQEQQTKAYYILKDIQRLLNERIIEVSQQFSTISSMISILEPKPKK